MLRLLSAPAHARFITRSSAQQLACKDPARNGQSTTITDRPTYTPVANRADSCSLKGVIFDDKLSTP
ncbi:Malolactic regulator [Lacticaseibacillus paracasei]|nr:Malolactic regulator [Lacticaseibacillus paracasei]